MLDFRYTTKYTIYTFLAVYYNYNKQLRVS